MPRSPSTLTLLFAIALAGCTSGLTPPGDSATIDDARDQTLAVDVPPTRFDAGSDAIDIASALDAGAALDALDLVSPRDAIALMDSPAPPQDARAVSSDGATCPSDMVAFATYCMDRYEAPNQPGASPLAFQTAIDGERWCAAHGKRLCNEAEWVAACEGARRDTYPYGATYVRGRCNDNKTWIAPNWAVLGTYPNPAATAEANRLYQADPSGSHAGCISQDGVMDLTGNVAEWVERSFPNANNYAQVMKGCYWSGCYGGTPPNCTFVNPAHPGNFRTYEAGFRCCLTR